jgi:hypothetical protein
VKKKPKQKKQDLEPYGFSITDEEEHQIIDGTHELYTKPKPEKEGKK